MDLIEEKIINLVEAGDTISGVSRKVGCSENLIREICTHHNIDCSVKGRHDRIAKIIGEEQLNLTEAMQRFGLCEPTLKKIFKKHKLNEGEKFRKPRMLTEPSYQILAMLIRGQKPAHIAQKYGISRQRVHQIQERAERCGVFRAVKEMINGSAANQHTSGQSESGNGAGPISM